MPGWNLVRDVFEGSRPLVRDDLWDEIRGAAAERWSAAAAVRGVTDGTPDGVAPRDPIGGIADYRQSYTGLIQPFLGPFSQQCWAKEVAAAAAVENYGCPRWWPGINQQIPIGDLVNIFTEAGLPGDWWTCSAGPFASPPVPPLPKAALWTDFYQLLKIPMLMAFDKDEGEWTRGDGREATVQQPLEWIPPRAAAWANLAGPVDPDTLFLVGMGRYGRGSYVKVLPENYYEANARYVGYTDVAYDLSPLWDVRHLGGASCDPTRLIVYLRHKPKIWIGPAVGGYWLEAMVAGTFEVRLSGDGGATWEGLGQFTADLAREWTIDKFVSLDSTRWTAQSVLRIAYAGDPNVDTPGWTSPNGGYTEYCEGITPQPFIFADFDWDYTT